MEGVDDGSKVGLFDGNIDDCRVGRIVGIWDGIPLGTCVKGFPDGILLGREIGLDVGCSLGLQIGRHVGQDDGSLEGGKVGCNEGWKVGKIDGFTTGLKEGFKVGSDDGIVDS